MNDKIVEDYNDIFKSSQSDLDNDLKIHIEKLRELDQFIPHSTTFFCVTNTLSQSFEFVSKNFTPALSLDIDKMCHEGMTYWWSRMHPDEMQSWLLSLQELMAFTLTEIPVERRGRMTYTWNYRIMDGQGTYKNIIQHTTPIHLDEDGKPIIGIAHYSVISALEKIPIQASAKILNSNNEYETLYYKSYNAQKLLAPNISHREIDILRLVSFGFSSEEIAEKLNISHYTVKTHRKNLLEKSQCKNTTELVALCIRQGII